MVDLKKPLIDDIHFRRDYDQEMCQKVWREKHSVSTDNSRADSVDRLVSAVRNLQTTDGFEVALSKLMLEGVFIPAGRVWSGMGTDKFVTLMNCYVMGQIPDNLAGIFKSLMESALTMQQGGGIGMDFSTLRPKGSLLKRLGDGAVASGPLSFMEVWDSMCRTIMSAGSRRGAMMATLRCDHPDVRLFIEAKSDPKQLRMFNLSVLITDKFMEAVSQDKFWALIFDAEPSHPKVLNADDFYSCHNYDDAKNKTIYDIVSARELWESIMLHTYKYSDPGVIFIDRMNKRNNLNYCETIYATNPCVHGDTLVQTTIGEIPIRDLTRYQTVDVYTREDDGTLGIRPARFFRTKTKAKLVRVTTSRGYIRCTPDHKFLTVDGWVEAQHLEHKQKLIGLNRAKRNEKYLRVGLSGSEYVSEHRFVAEYYFGDLGSYNVHHLDDNTYHNSITNLQVLPHWLHSSMSNKGHGEFAHKCAETGQFLCKEKKAKKSTKPDQGVVGVNWYVLSVEDDGHAPVFDGNVEGTHNYIANGCVVHNCGEQPLPPYGACDLSQINLARLVKDPFTKQAKFDFELLSLAAEVGIEFLDLLIDISNYPLPEQKAEMEQKRRVGLGITGLADCVAQMGLVYGSPESVKLVEDVFCCLQGSAVSKSIKLARIKGSFPAFDFAKFGIRSESSCYAPGNVAFSIRNGTLLSVAPTGSVSLSMGYNTSSGVEPNFAHRMKREQLEPDGTFSDHSLYSYLYLLWCAHKNLEPSSDAAYDEFLKEPYAVTTMDISVKDHIAIQAACQKYVDTSISKTINCPPDISFGEFKEIYLLAYDSGCKGCTTYRETEHKPGILQAETKRVTLQAAPVCEETTVAAPEVQKGVLAAVERPNSLEGRTYKIKWPHLSAALYVTINNHNGKPYEIFITSKFLPNQEWTVALTRMISANWRRGGNNDFIFEELQEIQSQGNVGWFDGKMYPSLVAYLGKIISDHCRESGANTERVIAYDSGAEPTVVELDGFAECPKCGARSFVKQEGCGKCLSPSCGHSDCG